MCDVGKCKKPSDLQYSAFGDNRNKCVSVCWNHWEKHCDEVDKFDLVTYFYPESGKGVSGKSGRKQK